MIKRFFRRETTLINMEHKFLCLEHMLFRVFMINIEVENNFFGKLGLFLQGKTCITAWSSSKEK